MIGIDERPLMCVAEGLDRSGKTTLTRAFGKETKQSIPMVDRFTLSHRVYDRFFERETEESETRYRELEAIMAQAGLWVVFVDTPPRMCKERGAEYDLIDLFQQRIMFMQELRYLKEREPQVKIFHFEPDDLVEDLVLKMVVGKEWIVRLS